MKESMFYHIDTAIREFGYYSVISWGVDSEHGDCIKVTTRTQF